MTPQSFDFGFGEVSDQAYRKLVRLLEDAVAVLSLSGAASVCGCTAAQLRDAIDGRNNRHLPARWVMDIARRVGGDYRDRIQDALNEWMDPGKPDDDQAFIEKLIAGYKAFGETGDRELAAIRRRSKR